MESGFRSQIALASVCACLCITKSVKYWQGRVITLSTGILDTSIMDKYFSEIMLSAQVIICITSSCLQRKSFNPCTYYNLGYFVSFGDFSSLK